MLLLGFLSDDTTAGYDKAELKNISACWFSDCAQHSDLPYILQVHNDLFAISVLTKNFYFTLLLAHFLRFNLDDNVNFYTFRIAVHVHVIIVL